MPWPPLRSNTAGGRKSRRHSFFEKGPVIDGVGGAELEEPPAQPNDVLVNRSSADLPTSSASQHSKPAPEASVSDQATREISESPELRDAATFPKSHRFSLLRFRHASDPQLSRSYRTAAANMIPPVPHPTTPTIITTAPSTSPSARNANIKDKSKHPGRVQNTAAESTAIKRQSVGALLDGGSQSSPGVNISRAKELASNYPHISFEEPNRLSTLPARGSPPAYGEHSNTSLTLPPSRLSDSSRSDASSGEQRIYAETTTTHTVSTTTTFFRLPRRKKNTGHLFPLPVKILPPDSSLDVARTPRQSRSSRTSMSPGRGSPQAQEPVTAVYAPSLRTDSGSQHLSPLPSPTHSAYALTNAPLGSPGLSMYRKDSITSHRSARSTPSIPRPHLLGSRGRSSTLSSLKKAQEADRQVSVQPAVSSRTSTSTTGRKSFGDLFGLSHRLRQNSEPLHAANGRTASGASGTPASTGSKSNSFQIPREPPVYPERTEGDTPASYLSKLEEAVDRGVIAAILCKGVDDFSKTCLRKYMRGFAYFGDSIDMAVRKMLMEVELPKEAQQIDRLLQGFADRYCECNAGIFVSADEAYFVAFSILLLHSDTHNKNNKRKMQKQDYVKNSQDQVEVSHDILECFYDNVSYTPFIHFEDEVAINSHRLAVPKPKKTIFKAPSNDSLRGPVDPYALILDQKVELLRPSLKDVMDTEDSYSYTGTASSMDVNNLYHAFHKAGVLQIVSARSRPDAFLSQATITNPADAQVGLVDIKAAKVGLLWRKDPKKKKARSPWQEWGALLTGSQLYFFRDVNWVKSLVSQHENHQKQGSEATSVVFKPPLVSFQPDALLSMDDAVALLDASYKKHKHAFFFVKHGGFEEVFLANTEADMNDWIAKLNYAATFRTTGVRMRGFIGANYEGRRPVLVRNDSGLSALSTQNARGNQHINGGQINHQLASEILAYRRQMMKEKIAAADEKLATTQKELDNLLRNARHLQICSPIQAKSREALVLAAGRMSAKLKWTRVEMWRTRCHRDVMKMDLEQEIGANITAASAIVRDSPSLRSVAQKGAPPKLSSQSLRKPETRAGDVATSPKSIQSKFSSKSTQPSVLDKAKMSEVLPNTLWNGTDSHSRHLSNGSVDQSAFSNEDTADHKDRASLLSTKSLATQSLNRRPSISSSRLGRSDADSVSHLSRLTTPTPSIDGEERYLREAGLLDAERTPNATRRPDTSESDRDPTVTSSDALSKEHHRHRRSLQRTLRDSPHSPHAAHSLRGRKGKELATHTSPASLRRSSQGQTEGLSRATGSFTVHGKKASVITFGSEWQSMSNEDRRKLRKQAQMDEEAAVIAGDVPKAVLSPKAEEDEGAGSHLQPGVGSEDATESIFEAKTEDSAGRAEQSDHDEENEDPPPSAGHETDYEDAVEGKDRSEDDDGDTRDGEVSDTAEKGSESQSGEAHPEAGVGEVESILAGNHRLSITPPPPAGLQRLLASSGSNMIDYE